MLVAVHLTLIAAYAGFQWTVRALVYPQFALVPPAAFPAYERRHQQRVARVVGPLFAGQGVTTLWLLADRPEGTPLLPVLLGAACLAGVLLTTGLGAVPLHRRLEHVWDDGGAPAAAAGGHRPGGRGDGGDRRRAVGAARLSRAPPDRDRRLA